MHYLGRRKISRILVILGLAACVGVFCLENPSILFAEILSGGTMVLSFPFFSAAGGGSSLSGGGVQFQHSVGPVAASAMSGGTLTLTPGLIGSQVSAQNALGAAHAFPTPFKPSLGHDRITFRGLTTNAEIRIYTVSGELVRTLSKNDPSTSDLIWRPVANSAGQPLASGVYLYVVTGDDSTKAKGKIMVIK